ncbi:MAG: hypothetical protein IT454_02600 [Planctomycetes bacterium]|nr:hypothetical protein [Planctomycetota bacterium]
MHFLRLSSFARRASVALLGLLGACAGVDPHVVNREALDTSYQHIQKQDYAAAAQTAEALYAGRADDSSSYKLQRYYAAYLAAQAHIEAALHKPFLTEAAPAGAKASIALGANAPATGQVASPTSHWLAASYYAGYASELFEAAVGEPERKGDEELLPIGLKKLDVARTQAYLQLVRLATLRRLGFDVECAGIVEHTDDLRDVAKCKALLEQSDVPQELWPWIFYAGFRYLAPRATDMRSVQFAYALGAQARFLAEEAQDAQLVPCAQHVRDWVEALEKYEFHCGCDKKFQANVVRCSICGESIVKAKLVTK